MRDAEATRARRFKSRESKVLCDGREELHGADMTERRRFVFERDGYRCQFVKPCKTFGGHARRIRKCMKPVTWQSGHLAHRVARWKGRDDRAENLQVECAGCHIFDDHGREPRFRWLAGVN